MFVVSRGSQSPYGAMRFATKLALVSTGDGQDLSQSPYGAMRFATFAKGGGALRQLRGVAIPLRGYAVCNTCPSSFGVRPARASRNPLTGLCGLQPTRAESATRMASSEESQSPYGAMRFATSERERPVDRQVGHVAIPLRGYAVCNLESGHRKEVANVVRSQSPYGAMRFATLPP